MSNNNHEQLLDPGEAMRLADGQIQDAIALLRERRQQLKLSQETVAKQLGIKQSRISELENKQRLGMSLLEFLLYCAVLGFKFDLRLRVNEGHTVELASAVAGPEADVLHINQPVRKAVAKNNYALAAAAHKKKTNKGSQQA